MTLDRQATEVRAGLPTVTVTRYATPLREGGSLPGIVEADDLGTYVAKFRGAGQGLRVLVAEVIVAELARRIGLLTPRQVVLDLAGDIARYEADEEVQDLLTASVGLNLGIDFLPGAFGYDGEMPGVGASSSAATDVGARILWLDAFTANVDRTWRNPNLLVWHGDVWVIDHGAALYFHHAWPGGVTAADRFAAQPWDPAGHVMLAHRRQIEAADEAASAALDADAFVAAVSEVPDEWLEAVPGAESPDALRAAYLDFLTARLGTRAWLAGVRA